MDISTKQMSRDFILFLKQETDHVWPSIYVGMEKLFPGRFEMVDKSGAPQHLFLAAVAQDLVALNNIFPSETAVKLNESVLENIESETDGHKKIDEINLYITGFKEAIKQGINPANVIPTLLLRKLFGSLDNFEVKVNGKRTGYLDPLFIGAFRHSVVSLAGTWNRISSSVTLSTK